MGIKQLYDDNLWNLPNKYRDVFVMLADQSVYKQPSFNAVNKQHNSDHSIIVQVKYSHPSAGWCLQAPKKEEIAWLTNSS